MSEAFRPRLEHASGNRTDTKGALADAGREGAKGLDLGLGGTSESCLSCCRPVELPAATCELAGAVCIYCESGRSAQRDCVRLSVGGNRNIAQEHTQIARALCQFARSVVGGLGQFDGLAHGSWVLGVVLEVSQALCLAPLMSNQPRC